MSKQMQRLVSLRSRQVDAARAELRAAHHAYEALLARLSEQTLNLGTSVADRLELKQAERDADFKKMPELQKVIDHCQASLMQARREQRQAELLLEKHRERDAQLAIRQERRMVDDWLQARHERRS